MNIKISTSDGRLYSSGTGWIAGFLLLACLLTYRSFETSYVFYISWVSMLALTAFFIFLVSSKLNIDKLIIKIFFVVFCYFLVGLILLPFSHDNLEHLKILIISTFYMCSSSIFSSLLLKSKLNFRGYTYLTLIVWVLVNSILLGMFFLDLYVPVKKDFSGVFHDRNVFSITTLLVMVFSYGFYSNFNVSRLYACIFYLSISLCCMMIVISKSITGLTGLFLLLGLYALRLDRFKQVLMLILILFLFSLIIFTDNPLIERIERFVIAITGESDLLRQNESAFLRLYLIESGIKLVMDYPFTGMGINNAKDFVIWPLRETGSFLHNTYLDILTGGGVILFSVYYLPIFVSLYWLLKNKYKVWLLLDSHSRSLWMQAVGFLLLKLMYDLTWTTYFEFYMSFSVIFSIYITLFLKDKLVLKK